MINNHSESIILGGGCFWCIEAAFLSLSGVTKAQSGYAGGHDASPSYKQVCAGTTGHAEVVLVEWDATKTDLNAILDAFFIVHDPTSLNRQGNDVGTQYRSFIGYKNLEQLNTVKGFIKQQQANFEQPIVTELQESPEFYPAEVEHDDYYRLNSSQTYCRLVIKPKLDKLAAKS